MPSKEAWPLQTMPQLRSPFATPLRLSLALVLDELPVGLPVGEELKGGPLVHSGVACEPSRRDGEAPCSATKGFNAEYSYVSIASKDQGSAQLTTYPGSGISCPADPSEIG